MSRPLDREDLIVPATRYYMGRAQTIGVTAHCQALARFWSTLSAGTQDTIRRDLEDAFSRDDQMRADPVCSPSYYPLGSDVDRRAWELVRAAYSGQETPAAPQPYVWICICGKENPSEIFRCSGCDRRRRPNCPTANRGVNDGR